MAHSSTHWREQMRRSYHYGTPTENEEVKDAHASASTLRVGATPRIAQLAGPDENRIRQLTDMGFPRSAAERALLRSRNNVSATTEFLLSHPFPLPPDPIPEAAFAEEE